MENRFPFKKTFTHTGASFSANVEAERWCKENNLGFGSMCGDHPRAIVKGEDYLPKWKNIPPSDWNKLDGVMTSDDFRNGDITIHLLHNPEE